MKSIYISTQRRTGEIIWFAEMGNLVHSWGQKEVSGYTAEGRKRSLLRVMNKLQGTHHIVFNHIDTCQRFVNCLMPVISQTVVCMYVITRTVVRLEWMHGEYTQSAGTIGYFLPERLLISPLYKWPLVFSRCSIDSFIFLTFFYQLKRDLYR